MKRNYVIGIIAAVLLCGCSSQKNTTIIEEAQDTQQAAVSAEKSIPSDETENTESTVSEKETVDTAIEIPVEAPVELSWADEYKQFLLQDGYRPVEAEQDDVWENEHKYYFSLIDMDGDDISELCVFDDSSYKIYHYYSASSEQPVCCAAEVKLGDFSYPPVYYIPGRNVLCYLEASRAAMHGYCNYELIECDISPDCGLDHSPVTSCLTFYMDPEQKEFEQSDDAREIQERLMDEYDIGDSGDAHAVFSDKWKEISSEGSDAYEITESNILSVLG